MSHDNTTPEQEVKDAPEETVNDTEGTGETTEETVGSFQEETTKKEKPTTVPMARLDKEIQRRKELEKELEELRDKKDGDTSVSDVEADPDVKALAEKLAKIEEKEKAAERDVRLTQSLEKALNNAPEFRDIVNPQVIKQMALNPANKDKTMPQLLEEAYGNAISGKRTTETTTPRGGKADTKVDMDRAQKDTEYRREVLADPDMRKQYNEGLENRINL